MSTPPTVHDSDRRTAEECEAHYYLWKKDWDKAPVWETRVKELAEISACHHAEERAAVEKAKKLLEQIRFTSPVNSREYNWAFEALTALRNASARTASQSPLSGWIFGKARPGEAAQPTTIDDVRDSLRLRDIIALCDHGRLSNGGWNWFSEPAVSQSPTP